MPYPSAYEAPPLDSAKRRALGTTFFSVWDSKGSALLIVLSIYYRKVFDFTQLNTPQRASAAGGHSRSKAD